MSLPQPSRPPKFSLKNRLHPPRPHRPHEPRPSGQLPARPQEWVPPLLEPALRPPPTHNPSAQWWEGGEQQLAEDRKSQQMRSRIDSRDTITSHQHTLVSQLQHPSLLSDLPHPSRTQLRGDWPLQQPEEGKGVSGEQWQVGSRQSANSHKSTLQDNTGESEVQPAPPQNRGKLSLRHHHQRQAKSELSYCLRYCDLVTPLRPLAPAALQELQDRRTLFEREPSKPLPLCGGDNVREGCSCRPRCHWVSSWLQLVQPHHLVLAPQLNELEWAQSLRQIDRDLHRTQPEHAYFKEPAVLAAMREVLVGYCRLDAEVAYVQGMNKLAALLVYHSPCPNEALHILALLMRGHHLRSLYTGQLQGATLLAKQLQKDMRTIARDLQMHLEAEGVQIGMLAHGWYLGFLSAFVPLQQLHLVVDCLIRRGLAGLNEIVITMLLLRKEELLGRRDGDLLLSFSGDRLLGWGSGQDWRQIVLRSAHLQLAPIVLT